VEAAQKRQAGIDEGGELTRENHQRFRLNFFALEKNDLFPFARPRDSFGFRSAFRRLSIGSASFAFFVNAGWEISSLAQLADGLVGRTGLNKSRGFFSARIESYVGETRHEDS